MTSRNEELLEAILNDETVTTAPKSRIEKIWHFALGEEIELDPPKSRIEILAIQVAEKIRNGGGTQPTGSLTITKNDTYNVAQYASAAVGVYGVEDGMIDRSLADVYVNSRVDKVGTYSLYGRNHLTKIAFPNAGAIGQSSMQNCYALEYAEFPSSTSFGANAFRGCSLLAVLNLYSPIRTSVPTMSDASALQGTSIADGSGYVVINDDLVNELKAKTNWSTYAAQIVSYSYAVEHDLIENLEYTEPDVVYHTLEDGMLNGTLSGNYTNDRVTELKQYGMTSLLNITGLSFPEVTDLIPNYFLSGCTNLQSVNFPKAARIGDHTFRNCSSLTHASFPKVTSISTYAFQYCSSLEWLSFDEITAVPTLSNTNAFQGCSALTALYFPDALVDTAKAASNWSDYASIIKPLSQKPSV